MRNIPELLSDWEDLDSEMRLRRFAAGTQPSLLLRRFFTNLHQWKHTGGGLRTRRGYAASIMASGNSEMHFVFSGCLERRFKTQDQNFKVCLSFHN